MEGQSSPPGISTADVQSFVQTGRAIQPVLHVSPPCHVSFEPFGQHVSRAYRQISKTMSVLHVTLCSSGCMVGCEHVIRPSLWTHSLSNCPSASRKPLPQPRYPQACCAFRKHGLLLSRPPYLDHTHELPYPSRRVPLLAPLQSQPHDSGPEQFSILLASIEFRPADAI